MRRVSTALILFLMVGALAPAPAALVRVKADNVNLRATAEETSEVVGQVSTGDELVALSDPGEPWVQVVPPAAIDLWVFAELVHGGSVIVSKAQVRAGAGLNFNVVGSLRRGTPVAERGRLGDWLKIAPPEGTSLWVSRDFIEATLGAVPPPVVAVPVVAAASVTSTAPSVAPPAVPPAEVPAAAEVPVPPTEPVVVAPEPPADPALETPAVAAVAQPPDPALETPVATEIAATPSALPASEPPPQTTLESPVPPVVPEVQSPVAATPTVPSPTEQLVSPTTPDGVYVPPSRPTVRALTPPATPTVRETSEWEAAPDGATSGAVAVEPATPAPRARPRVLFPQKEDAYRTVGPANIPADRLSADLVQGKRGRLSGQLAHAGAIFYTPSKYRLVVIDREGRATTVCYVLGNAKQLGSLLSSRLTIEGPVYWFKSTQYPTVLAERMQRQP